MHDLFKRENIYTHELYFENFENVENIEISFNKGKGKGKVSLNKRQDNENIDSNLDNIVYKDSCTENSNLNAEKIN